MAYIRVFICTRLLTGILARAIWVASVFLCTPSATNAHESLFELPLADLLDISVSSTTLTEKSQKRAPASVTVYTHAQIKQLGVQNLHELMNYVPGFQSFRQGEAGDEYYHSVRGHRVGSSSREVLILIDGQRFNRESDHAQGVPFLSLTQFAKIEFIRGPGSSIHGSNAYTGVINLISRDNEKELRLSLSDVPSGEISALWSGHLYDWDWDVYSRIAHDDGQEYSILDRLTLQKVDAYDGYKQRDLKIKLTGNNTSLSLLHYDRLSFGYPILEYSNAEHSESHNQHTSIFFKRTLIWNSSLSSDLSLRVLQNQYQPTIHLAPSGFALESGSDRLEPLLGKAKQKENNRELNIHSNYTFSEKHSLQFGLEHRFAKVDDVTLSYNYDTTTAPVEYLNGEFTYSVVLNPQANNEITGLYIQTQNQISETLELVAGLRSDHYSRIGDNISPRVALNWAANPQHTVKLLYGEAFRAPSANERTVTTNQVIIGNPNLKPETIKTAELNWLYSHDRFIADIAIFHSHMQNLIEQADDNGTRVFRNSYNRPHAKGIEAELKYRPNKFWSFSTQHSHNLDFPSNDFRQAETLSSVQVAYHNNKWNWGLSAYRRSKRQMQFEDKRIDLDSYVLARGYWRYISDFGEIEFNISNLLDEDYKTPSQSTTLSEGFPNRGREFKLIFVKAY